MKLGLFFQAVSRSGVVEIAQKAEALGFESLWRPDHLVIPSEMSGYPYTEDSQAPIAGDWPILDPFAVFSYLASATSTIRFGTGVYILPLRNPLVTARSLVTADYLTGGRVMLGVGSGWWKQEFDLAGEDFATRGARTDEYIQLIRTLCSTRGEIDFAGRFFAFEGARFEPKPVQQPHPPIHVGGESKAALRRAATLGDGWYAHNHSPAVVRERLAWLREAREAAGRGADPFEVTISVPPDITRAEVEAYEEAGAARLVTKAWQATRDAIGAMERIAERVL